MAGPCPECGGDDRFVIKDGSRFLCRNCHPQFGDVIDFHAWREGIPTKEFIAHHLVKNSDALNEIWNKIKARNKDLSGVYRYLCDERKISKDTVDKAIEADKIASYDYPLNTHLLNEHYNNGTKPHSMAFKFNRIDNGDTTTIEYISTTGKPLDSKGKHKLFERKTKAGNGFFQAGKSIKDAEAFVLVEAAINALSGVDCCPDACWLALGFSTMTRKLSQLKGLLRGRKAKIVCFFDHDEAGEKAVQQSSKALAREVHTVVYPDGTPDGYDVNDLLKAGQRQAVVAMIENAEPVKVKKPEPQEEERKTQSQILIDEAQTCDFFHTTDSKVYARVATGGHFETHDVKSKTFRLWLSHRFYVREKKAPSSQAMADALNVISGIGLFECPERELFLRVAEKNGCIYIDLCNDKWQAVQISADGWEIIADPPVYFRRAKGMKAMVVPSKNGDINDLRRFLNLSNDTDF